MYVHIYTYTLYQNGLFKRQWLQFDSIAPFKHFYGFMEISDMKMDFPVWLEILEPIKGHSAIYPES